MKGMKRLAFIMAILMLASALSGCRSKNKEKDKTNSEGNMVLFNTLWGAEEGLAAARAAGAVIMENGICTANKYLMEKYYENTQGGDTGKLIIAMYYTLDPERTDPEYYEQEKGNYPMLFFYLVEHFDKWHDGKPYRVTVRKSDESEPDSIGEYEYLMYYYDDMPVPNEKYDKMEHYVLTDDDTVTWQDISLAMVSSSLETKRIPSCMIFSDFIKSGNVKTEEPADQQANLGLFDIICSADEGLAAAREANLVITENSRCTNNKQAMEEFYEKTRAGEPAKLLLAYYYSISPEGMTAELYNEEKDKYPQLFFSLLEYDGEGYRVRIRKSDEDEPETDETAPYLMHYTGNSQPFYSSLYYPYDRYVLVNDESVTWEQIEKSMVSSNLLDHIAYRIVLMDLGGYYDDKQAAKDAFNKVCSADEALEAAKEAGAVVTEDHICTCNKDKLEEFFEKTKKGEAAWVLTAEYFRVHGPENGDKVLMNLFFVEYQPDADGGVYRLAVRSSADTGRITELTYKYLWHFTGKETLSGTETEYERYVLANDDTASWEQIETSIMLSSSTESMQKACPIFTEYKSH